MASDLYCSRGDVNDWIPGGGIAYEGSIVASSTASTDTIELEGHGFETDQAVTFRALDGGTLSAPLTAGTVYYVIRTSNTMFQLSETEGGLPIDLTTAGESMVVAREPKYEKTIEFYSRWADTFLPAHAVPLTTPLGDEFALVRGLVAKLTAAELTNLDGKTSDIIKAMELAAKAQLERFAKGIPVRGDTGVRTNLAISGSSGGADPRGWGSGSLP